MKSFVIGTAMALAMVVGLVGCGGPTVEETYNPKAGDVIDCSKYTIERNELKCLRDQSRH